MAGIFGVASKLDECGRSLYYGIDYHCHLGTDYAGMAIFGKDGIERKIHDIRGENFRPKFQQDYAKMRGKYGIGVIGYDIQPVILSTRHGIFSVVVNGNILNLNEIVSNLQSRGSSFAEIQPDSSISPAEVLAEVISRADDIESGIADVFNLIQGSVSLLILTRNGIYAARDRQGHSTLVVGKSDNEFAVTTETAAFPNLKFSIAAELLPGEIIRLTENGIERRKEGSGKAAHPCAFLWIYTSFPATSIEGINVEKARYNSGTLLAKRDKAAGFMADIVAGVPDSGVGHAIGYANESGIPYARPIVKYTPSWPRSYMPSDQSMRDLIADMKLIAIPDLVHDKRIVICDDSIVRGTQLRNMIKDKLVANGAREVHIRIACPPLMFPCIYNQSTRTTGELAARRAIRMMEGRDVQDISEYLDTKSPKYQGMVETIARELGATSLMYQQIEDMASAIGRSTDEICTFCWTGRPS
ncbi:MAG: amidophosphoribosyltransferase [Acidobacteria bacterium]|nr:amidophosphoribosyltransferase [Acidobacteriota bacterium]